MNRLKRNRATKQRARARVRELEVRFDTLRRTLVWQWLAYGGLPELVGCLGPGPLLTGVPRKDYEPGCFVAGVWFPLEPVKAEVNHNLLFWSGKPEAFSLRPDDRRFIIHGSGK